jgi:hypothetical protein
MEAYIKYQDLDIMIKTKLKSFGKLMKKNKAAFEFQIADGKQRLIAETLSTQIEELIELKRKAVHKN